MCVPRRNVRWRDFTRSERADLAIYDFQLGRGTSVCRWRQWPIYARNAAAVALRILRGERQRTSRRPLRDSPADLPDWRKTPSAFRVSAKSARACRGQRRRVHQPSLSNRPGLRRRGDHLARAADGADCPVLVERVRRRRVERALRDTSTLPEITQNRISPAGSLPRRKMNAPIARDLHDDVCQRLAVLAMMLSSCSTSA